MEPGMSTERSHPRVPPGRPVRVAHLTTTDLTLRYLLLGQLRRLRDDGYEVTGISAPGPYGAELEAEGIRHLPWKNATRSWNLRGTCAPSPSCGRCCGASASTWSTPTTPSLG